MLTATEYHRREPVPLHRVHAAVLEFCRARREIIVVGSQAVDAYTAEPRRSQDVDLLSPRPRETAEALRAALAKDLRLATRVRGVSRGKAFRVDHARKDGPRHLADVRLIEHDLGAVVRRGGVRYVPVDTLVAMKVCALAKRRSSPKGATDLADLRRLLLAHPELRAPDGAVAAALRRIGGGDDATAAWRALLAEPITRDDDEDY